MVHSSQSPGALRPEPLLLQVLRPRLTDWWLQAAAVLLVLGALPALAMAQSPPTFEVPITVTDGAYTTTLTIGMRDGALSGRDEYDRAAPPPPPAGAFDARLLGTTNAYFTDVRPLTDAPVDFEVAYQASNSGGPIVLSWPSDQLIDYGSFEIVDRFGTGTVSIDMTDTDRLDTSAEAILEEGLVIRVTARSTPLPVELSSFVGRQFGRGMVRLQWQTQSETNNAGFDVEQRRDDGSFRQIAFVPGAGTTRRPQDYRHRVEDLLPGPHSFRLRQIDHDGSFSYSESVEVQVSIESAVWMQGPSPNPVRSRAHLTLAVEKSQRVIIETFDLLGRRVHHSALALTAHRPASLELDVDQLGLPSGLYFVHVRGETFATMKRMTVLR